MANIDAKHIPLLLEAIEELLYKTALRLEEFKGEPMNKERRELSQKQRELEQLRHELSTDDAAGSHSWSKR